MAAYLSQTLLQLVQLGANITIEEGTYLPQTLIELATVARSTGAHITLSGNYLPTTVMNLATILGNRLTVVVSKS